MISVRKGGILISRIHQVCGRVWSSLLRENNLGDFSGARGRILFVLWKHDKVSVRILSEQTGLDKSTLTGILERLERDGYIERVPDREDKRVILICRTGKDDIFRSMVPAISEKMNAVFYRGFTDDETELFDHMLERVLENCMAADR